MADEYTPTIAEVREAWGWLRQEADEDGGVVISFEEAGDEFDRCLAQHDREVRTAAWDEGALAGLDRGLGIAELVHEGRGRLDLAKVLPPPTNPYRIKRGEEL